MINITVDRERCKGCSLCVPFCPKKIIQLSAGINSSGYHPAEIIDQGKCTGCGNCAKMCPDLSIEIIKEV